MMNVSQFKRILWRAILLLTTTGGGAVAEIASPGEYEGNYHRDRWNQGRFGYLFVAPELHQRLQQTQGRRCIFEVTRIDQPMRPGGAMATTIREIRYLPQPVQLSIEFADSDNSHAVKTLSPDQSLRLKVTLTNRTDNPISLNNGELLLGLSIHYPSGAGTTDPMGFWSFHDGMHRSSTGQSVIINKASANILGIDQTLNAVALHARLPGPRLRKNASLAPGKSRTWTTTLTNLPPNEFEVVVTRLHYDRKRNKRDTICSNILQFNVITDRPLPYEGLSVTLRPIKNSRNRLNAVFTNHAEESLRFAMFERGGQWDCSPQMLFYDAEGTQLELASPEGEQKVSRKTLKPKQSLTVRIPIPPFTALARCAFYHRIVLNKQKEGVNILSNGFVLSPHLVLNDGYATTSNQSRSLFESASEVQNMAAFIILFAVLCVASAHRRRPSSQW